MVDISSQNNKINITVSSSGNTANTNVTPDYAQYYSEKSKEWAISDRIIDNTDYSSKYYAEESKKQADISTAKATEVIESGNNAISNIENARDNAIIDITNQETISKNILIDEGATQVANVNSAGTTQINLAKEQVTLATNQANIATEQATIATNKTSEVVASGNEALSNIYTAKDNAITTITTQETTSKNNVIATGNEQVARIEATGNSYDNLTHKNITNCLLEVPQRIKLELNDGVLTLKAGSQVIVPNGFETDGTTPKFDEVVIKNDISQTVTSAWATGKHIICYNRTDNAFLCRITHASGTSPSGDYTIYYNTATNVVRDTNITDKEISLPIGFATVGNLAFTSINQVFNGMGYIGSTVWVDKGVKGLIPNGRNADGTLRNIEYTTEKLAIKSLTTNSGSFRAVIVNDGTIFLPAELNFTNGLIEFNVEDNYFKEGSAIKYWCEVGGITADTASPYTITSFNPKLPFRITDNAVSKYGDTMTEGAVLTFLNKSANSYIGIATRNKYADVAQSTPAVQEDYMYINCFDKNDKITGEILTKHMTSGAVCTCVRGYGHSTGKQVMSELQVGVDVNGKAYATAPPSYATNSIVTTTGIKKATNGYLKLGNGIIIQWGTFKATVEGTSTITFPTPFSNAGYAPFCRRHQAGDNAYENGFASSRTTTSFKVGTWKDYTYSWYAIGY